MVTFDLVKLNEKTHCSFCGEVHREFIDIKVDNDMCSGLYLSRRCAKKFKMALEKFMRLNASGAS